MPETATADRVDRAALLDFLRPRHRAVLLTRRRDGGPPLSPVTCGVDAEGRIVVSTCPQRAEVADARRDPAVSDEYRAAMARQGESLLRITPSRWGPVPTGGFPAGLSDKF